MIGNEPYLRATWSRFCAFSRCCQSGVRWPGRRRGISSARAAFSRKRAPKRAVWPTSPTTSSSISSGPIRRSARLGGASASGRWSAIPSSDQIDCASSPSESRSRAVSAIPQGACTRPPNGVRMQTRQSPISSRKRSTTIARSEGTTPVAAACSRRKVSRFCAARGSRWYSLAQVLERLLVGARDELARGAADLLAQLVRAPDALALPERDGAGDAGRGRDDDAVAGDLLDPPGRGAEHERLALPRLVDHLLVELADAAAAVDEVDAVEAAVGDRARVRDREPPRAGAAADDAGGAVPDDPRPQLGELVRRVAAGEHVEHVLELLQREVGEGVGAADEPVQLRDLDLLLGHDRDDLLREHVERVARDPRLLDLAAAHRPRDDGRLEQVGAELGEDAALRGRAELVPGAADPLQAARDRLRALDLDHEVDRAHVDPELEARRRDEARDPPRLQLLLDHHPLLARQRAVVRARDLLLGQLVQPHREPLGEAAVVDEDDRRAVLLDELEQGRIDRRPDRARGRLVAGRHHDVVVHDRLRRARSTSPARAGPRPGRRPRGRAPCACRRRRAGSGGRRRRSGRSPRAGAASPRGRSAAPAARAARRAARARARGGRRAWCRRRRAPRRRSRSRSRAASRAPARSASGRATRGS